MTRNAKNKTPAQAKADTAAPKKRQAGPFQYLAQVRQEARKVTWTTRQELIVSTIMVLILSLIAMLFFWGVDWGIRNLVQILLSLRP
ncbi:MAG: preprotein translocase subunit SecE [Maricaulis sp.]|nr:preprotein translocase subunit SecE [Maricaulis sp.]